MTTVLIGTACTVSVAVDVTPPLVAPTVTEATRLPVTVPVWSIVAIVESRENHVRLRPVSTLPAVSLVVADNCVVCPTITLGLVGESTIVATGTRVTVSVAVPTTEPDAAWTVAAPGFRAITKPDWSTPAMVVSLIDQITDRPVSTWPVASFVVSMNCVEVPTRSRAVLGATTTDATGTGRTVICAG